MCDNFIHKFQSSHKKVKGNSLQIFFLLDWHANYDLSANTRDENSNELDHISASWRGDGLGS